MLLNNKTIKLISALLIISILAPTVLFSKPKKAEALISTSGYITDFFAPVTSGSSAVSSANETTQTALKLKDIAKEVIRQVLMKLAQKALQEMTKSTINWINSGFHGAPLFLENPQSFFKDIGKYEVKTFIDQIGYNSLKFPFGKSYSLGLIDTYKRQLEDNAQYTLSKVINDPLLLESYRNDFSVGGWNGFLMNTQYPQNNYLGFQMIANREIARRVAGTSQNAAEKVATTLEQGMGFLSPKTCPSNPAYNNLTNEFQRPSFETPPYIPLVWDSSVYASEEEYEIAELNNQRIYELNVADEKTDWETTNGCPGGLVNTTPGSVVANQVTNAMGSQFRKTELAGALGNSLSAITDALLNKFMGDGLNALKTTVNPRPVVEDNWDYYGNTLGSPLDSANNPWDAGPDEEIVLSTFKKQLEGKTIVTITDATGATTTTEEIGNTGNGTYIPGDILNTETEIKLITNADPTDPGILEVMSVIWPKVRELDICIPGPNYLWEKRIFEEMDKANKEIQKNSGSGDEEDDTAVKASLVMRELQFATTAFKDWVYLKMISALSNSITYMDAVDEVDTLNQQAKELTDAKRTKGQALRRLQAIKKGLDAITTQPAPGSAQEKALIKLRKEYNATRDTISIGNSIDNRESELLVAKEKYFRLAELIIQCGEDRVTAEWANPGGQDSLFSGEVVEGPKPGGVQLCLDINLTGGCETFNGNDADLRNNPNGDDQASSILVPSGVTAALYRDPNYTGTCETFTANDLDLRNNSIGNDTVSSIKVGSTCTATTSGGIPETEKNVFCTMPIIGGYPHDMFLEPWTEGIGFLAKFIPPFLPSSPEYEYLPLVNAKDVLIWDKWAWGSGDDSANIEMNCDFIFNTHILDYKGDIPGPTNVKEKEPDWSSDPGGGGAAGGGDGGGGGGAGLTCADVPTAQACTASDQSAVVAEVKAFLIGQGVNISGNCGAFEITRRVACAVGVGYIDTFHSSRCGDPTGPSADLIGYPDGFMVDILGSVGGANTPTWQPSPASTESGVGYAPASGCPIDPAGSYTGAGGAGGGGDGGLGAVDIRSDVSTTATILGPGGPYPISIAAGTPTYIWSAPSGSYSISSIACSGASVSTPAGTTISNTGQAIFFQIDCQ